MLLTCLLVLTLAATAMGEGKAPPEAAGKVKIIPPSSRLLMGGAAKAVGAKQLAARVDVSSAAAYGFADGISEEKGSFKLGALMTDVEAAVKGGDRAKAGQAFEAMIDGLTELGAPMPLLTAMLNAEAAVASRTDLQTVNAAVLPVIRPFIEDFVVREGQITFFRLGEWVESSRLILAASDQKYAAAFLADYITPEYFREALQGKEVSPAVLQKLEEVASFGKIVPGAKRKAIGEREVRSAQKALDEIWGQMLG
jgi:hypothetical protein